MVSTIFFTCLSVLLFTGAGGKKEKDKSDLTLLFETQKRWKAFWNAASKDIAVNNCEQNCRWKDVADEESKLRTETVELVMRQPQFEASLAQFLALSARGANPEQHSCQPDEAQDRDEYCICAHENANGILNWELRCSSSEDEKTCQKFLHTMCGIKFAPKEDLDDFEDLEVTEERLNKNWKNAEIGEVQQEKTSQTEEEILRLQTAMTNLDNERKQLYEVHAENTKGTASRPLLVSIHQRIERQKNKILKDMEAIINRREQDLIKETKEAERNQDAYQNRLQRLLQSNDDIQI